MAEKVCPVWVGYLLASPVRRLFQNPDKILSPYVEDGMTVLDIGCAMGFFSLSAAKMVGPNGKVICMDIQEEMIKSLRKRALKAGVTDRIETRICTQNSLELDDMAEQIDFAFAIAVAHEIPDVSGFFSETYKTLKPGHKFLVIEPKEVEINNSSVFCCILSFLMIFLSHGIKRENKCNQNQVQDSAN